MTPTCGESEGRPRGHTACAELEFRQRMSPVSRADLASGHGSTLGLQCRPLGRAVDLPLVKF